MYIFQNTTEAKQNEFRNNFVSFYNIGRKSQYQKIQSANNKGSSDFYYRFVDDALTFSHIQVNPKAVIKSIVLDLDYSFNLAQCYESGLPIPNFVVFNPESEHAQLWFILENGVYNSPTFRSSENEPLRYYKAVYNALCRVFKADSNFNQVLGRNPVYPTNRTLIIHNDLYKLNDFQKYIENIDSYSTPKKSGCRVKVDFNAEATEEALCFEGVPEGNRNKALFDFVRYHAFYRRCKTEESEKDFTQYVYNLIQEANKQNDFPLPEKECYNTADSIIDYMIRNYSFNAHYSTYDDSDRLKSLNVRKSKAQKTKLKIWNCAKKNKALSNRQIAKVLNVSTDTVNKAIKQLKAINQAAKNNQENKKQKIEQQENSTYFSRNNVSESFVNQFMAKDLDIDSGIVSPGVDT